MWLRAKDTAIHNAETGSTITVVSTGTGHTIVLRSGSNQHDLAFVAGDEQAIHAAFDSIFTALLSGERAVDIRGIGTVKPSGPFQSTER